MRLNRSTTSVSGKRLHRTAAKWDTVILPATQTLLNHQRGGLDSRGSSIAGSGSPERNPSPKFVKEFNDCGISKSVFVGEISKQFPSESVIMSAYHEGTILLGALVLANGCFFFFTKSGNHALRGLGHSFLFMVACELAG